MDANLKETVARPAKTIAESLVTILETVRFLQNCVDDACEDDLYDQFEDIADSLSDAKEWLDEIIKEIG